MHHEQPHVELVHDVQLQQPHTQLITVITSSITNIITTIIIWYQHLHTQWAKSLKDGHQKLFCNYDTDSDIDNNASQSAVSILTMSTLQSKTDQNRLLIFIKFKKSVNKIISLSSLNVHHSKMWFNAVLKRISKLFIAYLCTVIILEF